MSACPTCGAIPRPNDRYCNTCGRPVLPQQGQNPAPYGAPPPQAAPPQGYASAPPAAPLAAPWGGQPAAPARCQLGHDIAAGQNYCSQGHPIALEGVQFAGNPQPYGAPPPGPAAAPYQGYAAAPPPAYAFVPPQQGYAPPQPVAPQQAPPQAYPPAQPQPLPAFKPPPDEPNAGTPHGRVLRGFLVSYQVNPLGDFWPLYSGRLTIGRSNSGEALDVPLADATISSRHAALTIDATGSLQVEDTGSTNGTFVNDEHLGFNGRRELHDGDRVRFGGYVATIKIIARS